MEYNEDNLQARRVRRYLVDEFDIKILLKRNGYPDLIKGDIIKFTGAKWPEDSYIQALNYDPCVNGFWVRVWSISFDIVERGKEIPEFPLIFREFEFKGFQERIR